MSVRPAFVLALVALTACGTERAGGPAEATATSDAATSEASTEDHVATFRDPDVPPLPFDDNPDPDQCGIPVRWGTEEPAFLSGIWEGELIQPEVMLYDSHLRLSISGRAAHGSEVRIILYQSNPVLDYYLIETVDGDSEGWVPAPFLSFEPVET